MTRIEPDKLEEWLMELSAPLPWQTPDEDPAMWDDNEEASSFASAQSLLGR